MIIEISPNNKTSKPQIPLSRLPRHAPSSWISSPLLPFFFYFFLNPPPLFPLIRFPSDRTPISYTHFPTFQFRPSFYLLLGCSPMASFTVPCPKPSTLPAFRSASHNNCHRTHIKQNLSLHRRPFCLKDSFSFGSSFVHPPFSGIQVCNSVHCIFLEWILTVSIS